ncbi:MAG: DUF6880 family protein [Candidatus Lariskella arthropodorum]
MSKKKSEPNELILRELLISTNHEKLVDILLSLHASNHDVQKQLDIIFAGLDEDPKKIVNMIKKEIASLRRSSKFVDYYESDSLADRLNDLRLRIINDLNDKSPKIAFEIMLDFLDLHKNTLERVDDSNGTVSGVFFTACDDLGSLAGHINHLNNQEIVEIIFTRFMNNNYGIYDDIIHSFKGILKDQDFNLLQEKLEYVANDKNVFSVKFGLKAIADCKNDVGQYIAACSFKDGVYAHDHLDIAQRLIKHWRPKEALEWLDSMAIPINHSWQQDKKNLKIQALELDGNYEQAQKERLSWFVETLSPKLYGEILKAAKPDFKETFQSDAIKKAFQFPEPHTGLSFLFQIKEFEEVAKFVHARFNELNGRQYYTLRPAADLLQNTNPIAATLLYRKMIEPVLDETKSKYYNYAAKDLVACSILDSKIANWGALQRHDEYLKEIEIKHKRKISFWAAYKSVLQKQAAKEAKMARSSV